MILEPVPAPGTTLSSEIHLLGFATSMESGHHDFGLLGMSKNYRYMCDIFVVALLRTQAPNFGHGGAATQKILRQSRKGASI